MIIIHLIKFSLILLDGFSRLFYYLCCFAVGSFMFLFPIRTVGLLAGKIELSQLLMTFAPFFLSILLVAILTLIKNEISTAQARLTDSLNYPKQRLFTKKKELSQEISKLEDQVKARKEFMDHKFKENMAKLEEQKQFFIEEKKKHQTWLKSVAEERIKIKREIDHLALNYSADKLRERLEQENDMKIFDFPKKKTGSGGNFH